MTTLLLTDARWKGDKQIDYGSVSNCTVTTLFN